MKQSNKLHDFIPADYLFCVPSIYLALGLFCGITLGTKIQIFNTNLNFAIILIIIISLFLTNKHSKTLSLFISFFIGLIFQNSWKKSMEIGENLFRDSDTIQISVNFYSPPKYRSEKVMEQSATISKSDYRINLIFNKHLTDSILVPGENAKIWGIFRKYDTKNTAAPWEYDNIFQEKIKNSIGELEVISLKKQPKMPFITSLYHYIRKNFEKTRYESFYISIFTGDRSFLTQYISSFFRESGLVHFLAISGLHIAILIFAFSAIVFVLPLPILARKCAVVISILFLPFIAGFGPATLRAVIMGTIMVVSPLFNRKSTALNSLFLSCFLILSFYPMHMYLIGFQYSFAATFAVLILPKLIGEVKYKKTILVIAMPIFLFIVTTPIQIYHFGTLTSTAAPADLVLLPLLQIVCQIALFSLFIPIESVSNFLCSITDWMLDSLFWIINKYVISTGWGENHTDIPLIIFIIIITIIIVLCAFRRNRIIYSIYAFLFISTAFLCFDLYKKDAIYTISSQNFRMKLFDSNYPIAVVLGSAQTKNYYNPSFLRWIKVRSSGKKPILISDDSYIPQDFRKNFTHIILRNTTGEIYFDISADVIKTPPISADEKKRRKIDFAKKYNKTRIK